MENLNLNLSGEQFTKAAEMIISSLVELQGAIQKFATAPADRLKQEVGALNTAIQTSLTTSQQEINKVQATVRKAGAAAAEEAARTGKATGKAFSDQLQGEIAKIRLTVPGVVLPGGIKASIGASGLGAGPELLNTRARLISAGAADPELDKLAKASAAAIKAATVPGYLPAGPAWWEKTLAEQEAQKTAASTALIRRQVAVASASPVGPFSVSEGASLGKVYGALEERTNSLAGASGLLSSRSREVHSALRGVAAAADQLFLTYGAIIPLTTTFFAASAVRQSFAAFKDIEYQLKFVQALSGDVGKSFDDTFQRLNGIASQAGVAPVEAAKGLRMLAQSGLSTNEALSALPAILTTATVGELGFADAAQAMTGAVYAFNLSLNELGRVGDIFAKAGAVSNTSVSQIAESMKQASTVAGEFRVSIEDTATALVALAKRNITGSAAGTAWRNLLTELASPKGDAKRVAQQLGINLFDPIKGTMDDFFGKFIPTLREKIKVFDPRSQAYIFSTLANERGAKALSALMGLDDAALAEVKSQLSKAEGFAAQAKLRLADSVQGDLDKLKASFTSSLASAGQEGEGGLRSALQSLRETVESKGFQTALSSTVQLLGALAQAVGTLATVLTNPAVQLAALGVTLVSLRMAAAGAGTGLLALGGAMGAVSRAFVGVAVVTGVVEAFSALYSLLSNPSPAARALKSTEDMIAKQEEFNNTLREQIRLQKIAKGEDGGNNADLQEALRKQEALRVEYENKSKEAFARPKAVPLGKGAVVDPFAVDVQLALSAYQAQARLVETLRSKQNEMKELLRDQYKGAKVGTDLPSGTASFGLNDVNGARAAYRDTQSEINNIFKRYKNLADAEDEASRLADAQLKARYDRRVITLDQFEAARDKLQSQHLLTRKGLLIEEKAELDTKLEQLKDEAKLLNAAANYKAKGPGGTNTEVSTREVQARQEAVKERLAAITNEITKLQNTQELNDAATLTRLLQHSVTAAEAAQRQIEANKQELELIKQQADERAKLNGLTERDQAGMLARMKVETANLKEQRNLTAEIERLKGIKLSDPGRSAELQEAIAAREKDLKALKDSGEETVKTSVDAALKNFDSAKLKSAADTISGSIADAIIDGTGQGAKSMGQILEQELLKKPLRMALANLFNPISSQIAGVGIGLGDSLLRGFGVNSALSSAGAFAVDPMGAAVGSVLSGFRASGGSTLPGNWYMAGENGKELINFPTSGRVYSAGDTANMIGGQISGGVNVTLAPNISIDSRTDRAEVAAAISQSMQATQRQMYEQLREVGVLR